MALEKYPPDIWLPLKKNWEWETYQWLESQTLIPGQKKLLLEDKNFLSPRGWVYSGAFQADSPNAGFIIEYTGPRGRLFRLTFTIQELKDYGYVNAFSPATWTITRWAESSAPEYAGVLSPSFYHLFQPKFSLTLFNGGLTPITVYKIVLLFLTLFED